MTCLCGVSGWSTPPDLTFKSKTIHINLTQIIIKHIYSSHCRWQNFPPILPNVVGRFVFRWTCERIFIFERKHKSANTPTAWNIWPAGGGVQKSKQESELSWSAERTATFLFTRLFQEGKCFGIKGEGPKYQRIDPILGFSGFQGHGLEKANCWIENASVFHSRCIPLCFMPRCECPGMCENGAWHTIALTSLFSTPSELKKLRNNEMCMPQYPDPLLSIVGVCIICPPPLRCKLILV